MKQPASPRPHQPRRRSARRLIAEAAALVAVTALSAGCGIHVSSQPGALPELNGLAATRDAAARTERATIERAEEMAALATECDECADTWATLARGAEARLAALGGEWDPWADPAPDGAAEPSPVAAAPVTSAEIVTWLRATAARDLAAGADEKVASEEARTLATVAASRLLAARTLAAATGVDTETAAADFTSLVTRAAHFDGSAEGATTTTSNETTTVAAPPTWLLDADDVTASEGASADDPEPAPPAAGDLDDTSELAGAIRTWDCHAQALPMLSPDPTAAATGATAAEASASSAGLGSALADLLLTRSESAMRSGVTDPRIFRCASESTDIASIAADVLDVDLGLAAAEEVGLREWGVTLLLTDIDRWAPYLAAGTVLQPVDFPAEDEAAQSAN